MRLLTAEVVQRQAEELRKRVIEIMAPCRGGGTVDFVPLAMQLAMAAVGTSLGVPQRDWKNVALNAMRGVAPADPAYSLGTVESTLRTAHLELFSMFRELVLEHTRTAHNDMISMLLGVTIDGRKLSLEDIILNCYSFVMGANTTTPQAASHTLLALCERPAQWRLIACDDRAVTGAVEEGLRWSSPVNHLLRRTRVPVQIRDVEIAPGELVCGWIASANRDERVFRSPYEFDIGRSKNPHLAFGYGVHYCNGAPAARLVMRMAFSELRSIVGRGEIGTVGEVTHLQSNFINGITRLPFEISSR